ncbi:MAG: long-chain fatty acid--CoA ligase [Euryarchaeota archaeon]|nr:long-chain fatty acid--CoA ligase [Euryarchaeota archaeon]MDE1882167.1 long-chain fatty acid--CoA ligase [Euryarchaeota archaeon]
MAVSMSSRPWLRSYPNGVPADVAIPNTPVADMLENAVKKWPARDALVFALAPGHHKVWTFTELWDEIERVSGGLSDLGMKHGDRIALYLPNCPQYIITYFAALRLGLTIVQISPLYLGDDLIFPIKDSGAKAIVTLDFLSHKLEEVWDRVPHPIVIVGRLKEEATFIPSLVVNGRLKKKGFDPSLPSKIPYTRFRDLRRSKSRPAKSKLDVSKDVAVFQYTGGTTGRPKAAMLTHRNLVANAVQSRAWFVGAADGDEKVLAVIPFFHVYGMTVAMNFPLFYGATLVVSPDRPEPNSLLKFMVTYHPTQLPGVPALYAAICNHPEAKNTDLRGVKICLSGSAPLPVEVWKKFEELTGANLIEGYGLSEASPATHANPVQGKKKIGSIGLPLPSTESRVVDPNDPSKEMPQGQEGELAIRGPQIMLGYWNRPEETANVLKNGWLITGDIAKVDEDGYAYIVDRKKDLILVGGFNVYPREVEEVLYQHPQIAEAAVIGVPHDTLGEVVKAFVVAKSGTHPTDQEIIDFVKSKIAHFKAPRSVEFRESLPKTLVGKVLRRELREGSGPSKMEKTVGTAAAASAPSAAVAAR